MNDVLLLTAIKKDALLRLSGSVAIPIRVFEAPSTSPPIANKR